MKLDVKKKALMKLRHKMSEEGGSGMFGGIGVSVKAKDKKSLLVGLEKAKGIVKKQKMETQEDEHCDMSPDEIKEKIKYLQSMLPKRD